MEKITMSFAPVVKHETIRTLLVLAAQEKMHARHLDVKSAYLNEDFKEEIYMEQPLGFEKINQEIKVLKLRKSIYGLKQSASVWSKKVTETLALLGFKRALADKCLLRRLEIMVTTHIY